MLSLEGDEWIVHDTRTMEDISAMWGFSHDDVWASTIGGSLIHFDGVSWEAIEWPDLRDLSDPCGDHVQIIRGMWGEDGILYLHTELMFFMWDGTSFTVLGYWPGVLDGSECAGRINIQSIWGNSPVEVFLAVNDLDNASRACGREEYVLWWDGTAFHWF